MKRLISLLLAPLFLLCAGCGGQQEASRQFFAMDTIMNVTAYGSHGAEAVQALLTAEMERAAALSVPLTAEAHAGRTWAEAKG